MAFALATIAIGILSGASDGLFGDSDNVFTGTGVTFGGGTNLIVPGSGNNAPLNSSHMLNLVKKCLSTVRQHLAHMLVIGRAHLHEGAQMALTLGALLGQDVIQMRLRALVPTGTRALETLRRAPICL